MKSTSWHPLRCKLCKSKANWSNEGSGDAYCTQCMEDIAFK